VKRIIKHDKLRLIIDQVGTEILGYLDAPTPLLPHPPQLFSFCRSRNCKRRRMRRGLKYGMMKNSPSITTYEFYQIQRLSSVLGVLRAVLILLFSCMVASLNIGARIFIVDNVTAKLF